MNTRDQYEEVMYTSNGVVDLTHERHVFNSSLPLHVYLNDPKDDLDRTRLIVTNQGTTPVAFTGSFDDSDLEMVDDNNRAWILDPGKKCELFWLDNIWGILLLSVVHNDNMYFLEAPQDNNKQYDLNHQIPGSTNTLSSRLRRKSVAATVNQKRGRPVPHN